MIVDPPPMGRTSSGANGRTGVVRRAALVLLTALATLAGVVLAAPTPPAAAVPVPATAAPTQSSDPDYATQSFADPWDFANLADFRGDGTAQGLAAWSVGNNVLDFTTTPGSGLILAATFPEALPHDRDTKLHPIDASTYTRVSFSLYSQYATSGGFFWYTCDSVIPTCENGFPIAIRAGWNQYSLDIRAQSKFFSAPAWSGDLRAIRLVPTGTLSMHGQLDWFRLTPDSGPVVPPASPVPLPVITSPSASGGLDYATVVRRDPWDMSQPTDVVQPLNASIAFNGVGQLSGVNTAPSPNDPAIVLPLAAPIDTARWHRLSFRVHYSGPFSLADEAGGGMVARLLWHLADVPAPWQTSQDIVVYPGWNDVTIDLATSPSSAITEPDVPGGIGWAGHVVDGIRFDPHEDRAARWFVIDDVRVAEDTTGYGGATDITFRDDAWVAGTTADVYADTDASGFDGAPIATGIAVQPGTNTVRWAPTTLPASARWIHVTLHHGAAITKTYATGPLLLSASPSPTSGINPIGALDAAASVPGGQRFSGWALDPETTAPIAVHLWMDGVSLLGGVAADGNRPDIGAAFPAYGAAHGFDVTYPVPDGVHSVCAWGINVGVGVNRLLGCRSVVARSSPIGALDLVDARLGTITVSGWAIDPDVTTPIDVHVYVNGLGRALTANGSRPDVGAVFPAYGASHGYSTTFQVGAGFWNVCAYAINVGPGVNQALGCRVVGVPADPIGRLDVVHTANGTVTVAGWAVDADTLGPIDVHVYVNGAGTRLVADASRPDIGALVPAYGPNHGFQASLPTTTNPTTVCAYAIGVGPGGNAFLGCRSA